MAISNKQKRQLTCQFCPKKGQKPRCECKKFWKEIYHNHRDEILAIYHNGNPPQPQAAKEKNNSS